LRISNCGLRIADFGIFKSIRNPKSEIRNSFYFLTSAAVDRGWGLPLWQV